MPADRPDRPHPHSLHLRQEAHREPPPVHAQRTPAPTQKREYLLKLDTMLREIEKNHHEVIERDDYSLPTTIGEKIKIARKASITQWTTRRSASITTWSTTTAKWSSLWLWLCSSWPSTRWRPARCPTICDPVSSNC